jgi:hypothetical protein
MKTSTLLSQFALVVALILPGTSATAEEDVKIRGGARKLRVERNERTFANDEDDPVCSLQVAVGCTVRGDGMVQDEDCESFVLPTLTIEPCKQTPMTTTLLYNGGDCSQSDYSDDVQFICENGANNSPPTEEGVKSFIVVTDAQGLISYHEDWVLVGTEYVLGSTDQVTMDSGFHIQIYDSDDKLNLLQEVVYVPSLCSSELEMLSRFGASQIISYTNQDQGIVSPFASFSYEVSLHVSISMTGTAESVSLKRLSLITSFAGYVNLDLDVRDRPLTATNSVTVTIPLEVDLAESRSHSLLTQVAGMHNEGPGGVCKGVVFDQFHTGGRMLD